VLSALWSITTDSAALYARVSLRTHNRDDNLAAMTAYFKSINPSPISGSLTDAADLKKFAADLMAIPVDVAFVERLIESYAIASFIPAQVCEFVDWIRSIATCKELDDQVVIVV
jgi:hypothetical protein